MQFFVVATASNASLSHTHALALASVRTKGGYVVVVLSPGAQFVSDRGKISPLLMSSAAEEAEAL